MGEAEEGGADSGGVVGGVFEGSGNGFDGGVFEFEDEGCFGGLAVEEFGGKSAGKGFDGVLDGERVVEGAVEADDVVDGPGGIEGADDIAGFTPGGEEDGLSVLSELLAEDGGRDRGDLADGAVSEEAEALAVRERKAAEVFERERGEGLGEVSDWFQGAFAQGHKLGDPDGGAEAVDQSSEGEFVEAADQAAGDVEGVGMGGEVEQGDVVGTGFNAIGVREAGVEPGFGFGGFGLPGLDEASGGEGAELVEGHPDFDAAVVGGEIEVENGVVFHHDLGDIEVVVGIEMSPLEPEKGGSAGQAGRGHFCENSILMSTIMQGPRAI